MDLSPSQEQALLQDSTDRLLARHRGASLHQDAVHYSPSLQQELAQGGYLAVASQEGFGPLDAALMVERVARAPMSVEIAASALVGPLLGASLDGPLALCEGLGKPTRYLPVARHACIETAAGLVLAQIARDEVEAIDSVVAYPMGVLRALPASAVVLGPAAAEQVRNAWRIAIASEAAGLMRGALDATIQYVKDRRQFGQPLARFQAIQHRLAVCEQIVSASFYLAMRAAHSQRAQDAATAVLYVQHNMRTVIYDCHQFSGAMGVTLEYPLHFWTYRLKFLQGELGGRSRQALTLADACWN